MPYKNPAKKLEYQREWYAARRVKGIAFLGGKCVECGTTEDLEIDHIDPATKFTHRIFSYSWPRIEEELRKCQLLCMKHHLDKTIAYVSTAGGTWKSRPCHKSKSGCHCSYHRLLREQEVSVMLQNRYKNSIKSPANFPSPALIESQPTDQIPRESFPARTREFVPEF